MWDRSADSWSGVTCKDGLVVGLDLSDESISGGIDGSSSLFKLEFLRSLNLAFNNFNYMAILLSLANLSLLENLNLSNAWFTRQIPAELSRLRKLRTLDLTYLYSLKLEKSSLRSLIGDLGELRELYLDMVNVSAEGSEWCDALSSSVPKLEVLSMSYCSFSGPIDASLMSLANLSVIRLRSNNLSTTVPSFLANFSSLKMLHLGDCGLQGEFPQKVFQVQTLQNLYLSSNELLKVFLLDFLEDSSLETLVMYGTNISGRIPDSIGNLRKLLLLDL
ncbi:receptor-like protein 7 [Eucalyptus grandis]|uniref:receptor-like protein 7 n=1 Tax=Eucalyptus grandis TaxID=71139 RepID=UPI00192E8DA4|nr:receptor-like protein 7 [Eucalyptus grandis]